MDVLIHFILPFAAIMLLLLVVHEAGHYFTAKLFGVKVLEAGVGLPPRIWGFRWHNTDYTLNAIPMGAFVRMLGEEDPTDPQSLAAQPKWKRTIIIGSGATMNLLLAIALFAASLMIPQDVSAGGAVIGDVVPGSPAEQAGLMDGDQIVEINGRKTENTSDATYFIHLGQGSTIDFTVKRADRRNQSNETFTVPVYARWDPPPWTDECGIQQRQGPTGISIGTRHGQNVSLTAKERAELFPEAKDAYQKHRELVKPGSPASCFSGTPFGFASVSEAECADFTTDERADAEALKRELFPESSFPCYVFKPPANFAPFLRSRSEPIWDAVPDGTRKAFESLILMRNLVWTKVRGFDNSAGPITGPVGIAQATGEVVEEAGWVQLVELAAGISMSLAVLNFLPIPMVDGGRLLFIFIEFVRGGKRIAPQKEALVHLMGLAAMLLLFFVVTYFDIVRIVSGDSLIR